MDILTTFSERIKDLMEENGLNAQRLGKTVGIAPQQIRRYAKGKDIYIGTLLKLADYFACSLDYLCGRSETYLDHTPKPCPPFMEWLPKVLKSKGKTTYQVFTQTRIKSAYFASWRQSGRPVLSSLAVLADFLDVSLDHLVGRER